MKDIPADIDAMIPDEMLSQLVVGFLDDAKDRLDSADACLAACRKGRLDNAEALASIRREAHTLKGLGGSFGFPAVTLIAQRLEDYLRESTGFDQRQLEETQIFIDRLQELVEARTDPGEAGATRILRGLPSKWAMPDMPASGTEVVVIAGGRILARAVAGELALNGCRVVTTLNALEGFTLIMRARPDLIVASAVMEGITGMDLARAFAAMSATAQILFALLTSLPDSHPDLAGLPPATAIIRHDSDLSGGVARVLARVPGPACQPS